MGILIHPKRWTSQPPQGARINFGHPLAKGLTFYAVFNAGAGIQQALLPSSLPGNAVGTEPHPQWQVGGLGIGHLFDGNWGVWYERGLWVEPATNLSIVARTKRIGTIASQDTTLAGKLNHNTGSAPFLSYRLNVNPSASAGQDNVSFDVATTSGNTFHLGTPYAAGSGATLLEHTHGGTFNSGNQRLYYNGIKRSDDNTTGTPIYDQTSTGRFAVANASSAAGLTPYPGQVYYVAVWNRVLTPAEMEWLHVEPYAMLIPSKPKRLFQVLGFGNTGLKDGGHTTFPRRYPSYQPQQATNIDFGNPLAKGLTFLSVFSAGAGLQKTVLPLNLPGNSVGTVTSPNWRASGGGKSQLFDGNWSEWYERGLWVEPANAVTCLVRLRRTGTNPQYSVPIIKTFNNAASGQLWSYGLEYNRAGGGQDQVVALIGNGGVGNVGTAVNLGTGATLNPHTLAMSYVSGALKLYFNGQLKQTDALSGALAYDTSSTGRLIFSGASAAAAGNEWVGDVYMAAVWNRVLSDNEMRLMHNEPYALFTPKNRRKYFIPLAPAASNVGNQGAPAVRTKRWTNTPPQGARINFSHPLAKGLTFYTVFNAGSGLQQALLPAGLPGNKNSASTVPTNYWTSAGSGVSGVGQRFAANVWSEWYERGLWVEPPTNMTAVVRAKRLATNSGTDIALLDKTFGNDGVAPFITYRMDTNPVGGPGQDGFHVYVGIGGSAQGGTIYSAPSGSSLNEHTFGMSYTSGSLRLYYNGIKREDDNITGTLAYDQTSTGRLIVGGTRMDTLNNREYNGIIYYAAVWNRVLSPAEMEWLHNEPYAMLLATRKRQFITAKAATVVIANTQPNVCVAIF